MTDARQRYVGRMMRDCEPRRIAGFDMYKVREDSEFGLAIHSLQPHLILKERIPGFAGHFLLYNLQLKYLLAAMSRQRTPAAAARMYQTAMDALGGPNRALAFFMRERPPMGPPTHLHHLALRAREQDDDFPVPRPLECTVCGATARSILLVPCRHVPCCPECTDKIRTSTTECAANCCPLCRAPIEDVVHIFL